MTDFTVTIDDQSQLDGLAYGLDRYNAEHADAPIRDVAAFVQFRMESAAINLAQLVAEDDIAKVVDVIRADPAVLAKAKAAVQADIDAKAAAAVAPADKA